LFERSESRLVVVTVAVFVRREVVAGVSTRTAKVRETDAPTVRVPSRREQTEPAAGPGEQDQPGELAAASKVVLEGTTSVSVTVEADSEPILRRPRV